jgi:8-oxo-dGTP pyrophosphatase MutT (NUDIX family)
MMRGSRRNEVPHNLRDGEPVRPNRGNIVDDAEDEESKVPKAACVLVVSDDGKVLAVSRRDNPNDFGLPGGKVEPGEDPRDAAARELYEETGLTATHCSAVFSQYDGSYLTTTFMCNVEGEIDTDESGVIRWVKPDVLIRGSFGDYNRAMFKNLGLV